jgi:hypothetical protein
MVFFKEKTHQYFNEKGEEYISGTTFLHKFQIPFDEDKFATLKAKKLGITKEEVIEMWRENSRTACSYGTEIHLLMENFITKGEKVAEYNDLYESFNSITFLDIMNAIKVYSEELLWVDEFKVAGTADLIIEHNDYEFSVGDFKTNKKIDFCNEYGNRLLNPVSHLSDCNYNIYCLQLSLYAYLFSLRTGKKCRKIFLMHLKDDKWNYIPGNYMEYEIKMMLKWYNKNISIIR